MRKQYKYLETNTELNWKQVVLSYKDLWQVEHAFRTELQGQSHVAFKAVGLKIPPRIISGALNNDKKVVVRL